MVGKKQKYTVLLSPFQRETKMVVVTVQHTTWVQEALTCFNASLFFNSNTLPL